MAFDRAALLTRHRRALHDTLSLPVVMTNATTLVGVALRARWHSKTVINGDLTFQGWSQEIDGLHSLMFDRAELSEKGIVLKRGDKVTFEHVGVSLSLDSLEPVSNEVDEVWRVVQS